MKTEDIINALAEPLGAAALNQRGHPADIETVIDKAITCLNRLNEHRFAMNWSLSELRDLFVEYGMPANDRGEVRPAQFAAWVVGLVRELDGEVCRKHARLQELESMSAKYNHWLDNDDAENIALRREVVSRDETIAELNDQIATLKTMLANVEGQRDAAETENLHLRDEIVFRDKTIAELEARLEQQARPVNTPAQVVLWNRPEQFGLPSGYTINNPDNLSPYQIGEGYRIATTVDDTNLPHDFFGDIVNHWISAWRTRGTFAEYPHRTYRVPADRPLPPLENGKP